MGYRKSSFRKDFDLRISDLSKKSGLAQRTCVVSLGLTELVFRCTVFEACAAQEEYVKLISENWIRQIVANGHTTRIPRRVRMFFLMNQVAPAVSAFNFKGDEKKTLKKFVTDSGITPISDDKMALPLFLKPNTIHKNCSYPSIDNLRKLFHRLGVDDIIELISARTRRDAELMIQDFQSVRTAIAHSSPPPLTINDVKRHLNSSKILIEQIDRILFSHTCKTIGRTHWV
jgi:hypothetical protein